MINKKELNRVLLEIITSWGIPGLGVGIVEEGEIVYARGFGMVNFILNDPIRVCPIRQYFSIGENSCSNLLQKPSC